MAGAAKAAEIRLDLAFDLQSLPTYAKELHPVVPVRLVRVLLPEGETLSGATISGYDARFMPYEARLASEQLPMTPGVVIERTVQGYYGGTYPSDWLGSVRQSVFRGQTIVEIPVYPLRVVGGGEATYIDRAILTVTSGKSAYSALSSGLRDNGRDRAEALARVDNQPVTESRIVPQDEEIGYLILGPRALIGTEADTPLKPLIAQKELANMHVTMVALEDVSASKDPKQIRDYIRTSHQKLSVDFVLLVGDKGNFPWKYVKSGMADRSDPVPSDQYYACLDNDFSAPNKIDWACEVAVGRVGAKTRDDVANWVEKTVSLETSAREKRNTNFLNFGEKLDSRTLGERILNYLINGHGQTPTSVGFPSSVKVTKLYETFSKEVSSAEFIEKMNSSDFHVVNHLGHANETYVFRTNASSLSQFRSRPAFYYTQGCYPNDPDQDNWTVRAVRMPKYGPAAMIANTRYGWYQPGNVGEGSSSVLHRTFWSQRFAGGKKAIGVMNHKAKEIVIATDDSDTMIYTALESNLIGDPALDLGF